MCFRGSGGLGINSEELQISGLVKLPEEQLGFVSKGVERGWSEEINRREEVQLSWM